MHELAGLALDGARLAGRPGLAEAIEVAPPTSRRRRQAPMRPGDALAAGAAPRGQGRRPRPPLARSGTHDFAHLHSCLCTF